MGGQAGESDVSLWGLQTVSAHTLHCAGLCHRLESHHWHNVKTLTVTSDADRYGLGTCKQALKRNNTVLLWLQKIGGKITRQQDVTFSIVFFSATSTGMIFADVWRTDDSGNFTLRAKTRLEIVDTTDEQVTSLRVCSH